MGKSLVASRISDFRMVTRPAACVAPGGIIRQGSCAGVFVVVVQVSLASGGVRVIHVGIEE